MRQAGFEPMTPAFEREKKVHASDRAATVFGTLVDKFMNIKFMRSTLGWAVSDMAEAEGTCTTSICVSDQCLL
jgi:hypothetical protein